MPGKGTAHKAMTPLGQAVEAGQTRWIRLHGLLPGAELHESSEVTWVRTPAVGRCNAACGFRMREEAVDGVLDWMVSGWREQRLRAGLWVSQLSTPADLSDRLRERRLACRKHYPGMALDLRLLARTRKLGRIEPVGDPGLFERFPHPFIGALTTERRRTAWQDLWNMSQVPGATRVIHLAAWRERRPVGFASVACGEGLASLHDVGVLPSARRQGVGTAITRAACEVAREAGCRVAILIASGAGERVYERVGFRVVARMSYFCLKDGD